MGRLTALKVERAGPGMHPDGDGLYLQIGKNGGRSWVYRFAQSGKERYLGLGSAKVVTLKMAREKAADARKLRALGRDPIEERTNQRLANESGGASGVLFSEAAEKYISAHEPGWSNSTHRQQWKNTIATYVNPVFGHLPVSDINQSMVLKVLEPIWTKKPETANRVRGRIETILDWATTMGHRSGDNPAMWKGRLAHLLPAKSKVHKVKHHAALPYADIPRFMAELRKRDSTSARALELCILTASRSGEAIGAVWAEINLKDDIWDIPPERMKADRPHRVPLVGRSHAILENMLDQTGPVFAAIGRRLGKPMTEAALSKMLALMGDWHDSNGRSITVHGFRSTFRDWVAEKTDFPRELAEVALAHTVGDETERAYQRGDLFEKRRKLMAAWEKYCSGEP